MDSGQHESEDGIVYWASAKIGEPVGFIAYDDTPEDWSVLNHIISMKRIETLKADSEVFTADNLCKLVFVHPCGSQCEQVVCINQWSWSDEINICVRYGTDSPEHKAFLEKQGA